MDTLTNVGVGGAANVAIDYAVSNIDALAGVDPTYINVGKIAIGAIGGAMSKNKLVRAAVDGIAVVGVSNLVAGLINSEETTPATAGLSKGTIGRPMLGNRKYVRRHVSGINGSANSFMGK